ncbi:receptor-like protein 35 [Salvia hispanica]|uniref:receptor-like protein 35 n=1 Tax=Salvia hispanica TaxID=49212 RepID=UPI002009341A|nr:receptor-like protein 35 [Salvia hispanica]
MPVSLLLRLLFFFFFFFFFFVIFVDGQCLNDQKKLLLELRSEFKFNSSISQSLVNWNETGDCCQWKLVECDDSGHVISLDLSSEGVSGRIGESSALFRLTYLSRLDLSDNDFTTSEIPNQFHRLTNLAHLSMTNSGVMGPFPSTLANLANLVELYLTSNFLTGSIPTFHNCKNIEWIYLGDNNLSGSLSHLHFQGLTNLFGLDLSQNLLNGTIPHHLFALPFIGVLYLSNNQFSGQIREISILDHSNLSKLDLSGNRIGGPIPNFFFQLPNMFILWLSDNLFNGTFKLNKIQSLTSLSQLSLSNNNLSVDTTNMSSSSHGYPNLIQVHLSSCNLDDFPDFRNASNLLRLDLKNNHLQGDIPTWIWETEKSYLDLSSNLLTGLNKAPIPPNFTYTVVLLANNRLTGMIPSSFCNASLLHVLDLSFNNLSGSIPPCIIKENLASTVLNLRGNKISGVIPDQFPSECGLQTFDVSYNNVGGRVPKSLSNCKYLEVMNVGNNNLKDNFPCMLSLSLRILVLRSNRFHGDLGCRKSWPNLQILDISSNDFSGYVNLLNISSLRGMVLESPTHGEIPDAIGNLRSLYLLNLSHNSLPDTIPRSLGALKELGSLDLSSNKLTGRIPDELTKLDFLSFLNLSYNYLTGPIPTGRQFQMFTADSYVGNSGLSGFPLNGSFNNPHPPADPSPSDDSESKDEEIEWEYVFAASGYVVGIGSVAWTLFCCRSLRERYFEKIEEIADKIFFERGRRTRHERRVRRRREEKKRRTRYFEKIEEIADKIFFERGRRTRHERRVRRRREEKRGGMGLGDINCEVDCVILLVLS